MALYALGDLHLSFGVDKPMDVFGPAWEGYAEKLRESLKVLRPEDTIVICGDLSWGLSFDQVLPDLQFLASYPGRKLLIKGNHDIWWETAAKMNRLFAANNIENIDFLHNNCHMYENTALCGTRGWFYEEETGAEHDAKIMAREVGRLKTSLEAAKARNPEKIIVFLHYPPIYGKYRCEEIIDLLCEYGVSECYYGHLHGHSHRLAFCGTDRGVKYHLVSADWVKFRPVLIKV